MSNSLQWDESRKAFYEVFYLTANHKASGRRFWLRGSLLKTARGDNSHFGGLWLTAFDPEGAHFTTHRYFPRSQCVAGTGSPGLEIAASRFDEGNWRAAFESDGHEISWNLHWQPNDFDLRPLPLLIRRSGLNKADVSVPNVSIKLHGEIAIDGLRYEFTGDPAAQAHHWGRHYARGWLWAHCNDFTDAPDYWFELLAVDLFGLGKLRLPLTMLACGEGNQCLSLTDPLDFLKSRASYRSGVWRAQFEKNGMRLEARISAPENGFVALPYISPQGVKYTCHNSCLCSAEVRLYRHRCSGYELLRELRSQSGAHAEFCTPDNVTPQSFRFGGALE